MAPGSRPTTRAARSGRAQCHAAAAETRALVTMVQGAIFAAGSASVASKYNFQLAVASLSGGTAVDHRGGLGGQARAAHVMAALGSPRRRATDTAEDFLTTRPVFWREPGRGKRWPSAAWARIATMDGLATPPRLIPFCSKDQRLLVTAFSPVKCIPQVNMPARSAFVATKNR
jgi:hypothetical protein